MFASEIQSHCFIKTAVCGYFKSTFKYRLPQQYWMKPVRYQNLDIKSWSSNWAQQLGFLFKDMRWHSRPEQVWTQGTGAGSPRPEPTWRKDRRLCRSADGHLPDGSSPNNQTSPRTPGGNAAEHPQAQTAAAIFQHHQEVEIDFSQELTFFAASSREFFTAAPSHLSIFTGFSSILHWNRGLCHHHAHTLFCTVHKDVFFLLSSLITIF